MKFGCECYWTLFLGCGYFVFYLSVTGSALFIGEPGVWPVHCRVALRTVYYIQDK